MEAKGGCVLPDSGVFVQPFFKVAEGALQAQFAPGPSEKQQHLSSYREGTENMICSVVLIKENKQADGFVFIYFLCRL